MANSAEVLKEYVAILGFQVNEQSWRKFEGAVQKSVEVVGEIAVAAAAVAEVVDRSVSVIAARFEKMYYAAQLAGTSVEHLSAIEAGAQKIGLAAGEASASIQALASQLRASPGSQGLLASLGINTKQDDVKVFIDLIDTLKKMGEPGTPGYAVATQYASMFGISEPELKLFEDGNQKLKEGMALREKMYREMGLNPDTAAKQFVDYQNSMRDLHSVIEILEALVASRLAPAIEWLVKELTKLVAFLGKADKATHGATTWGIGIASILSALTALPKIVGFLLRRVGLGGLAELGAGGAAAAGGEAAAGGAVAAGGIAALVEVIVPIALAVLAALGIYKALEATGGLQKLTNAGNGIGGFLRKHLGIGYLDGDGSAPAGEDGVAGNNPGNMRAWGKGQTTFSRKGSGSFVAFGSAMDGLSAMAGQLLRYGSQGIDTASSIAAKWAPKGDHNDPVGYAAKLAAALGVSTDAHLNLHDPATLQKLMHGIIVNEQKGGDPYSATLMQGAIQSRLAKDGSKFGQSVSTQTTIHVNGAGDASNVARMVADNQTRVTQDALRNLKAQVN